MPSRLARKIADNQFVFTAEAAPPRGTDLSSFLKDAVAVAPHVDALNVTDNQGAHLRMSPICAAGALVAEGIEPIMQLTCRDRNRLALQSELLGAASLGIHNVLALTGDDIGCGDHREGRSVFDLDSVQLLQTMKAMNDGSDMNGGVLKGSSAFFAGAAAAPEAEPFGVTLPKLRKKAAAGARYFQTQAVFSPEKVTAFCDAVAPLGAAVVAGIIVLRSASMAEYINSHIPGLRIPAAVIERLRNAADPAAEGLQIAIEMARHCRRVCSGIHIMSMGRDQVVPLIVEAVR